MGIYKSFKEAFVAMGYQPKERKTKEQKEIKCRICGAPMVHKEGTNVVVCTGKVTDKEGKERDCKNFILWQN